MKKAIYLIVLAFVSALTVTSCKNDDAAPSSISGNWKLQSVESEIKLYGEAAEKESEDVSAGNLFIEFKGDGTFNSNSVVSSEDLELNQTVSGTYEVKDGYLTLKYKENTKDNTLFLKVTTSTSSELVLTLDKDALTKTAAELAKTNPEDAQSIQLILVFAETFTVTMKYKK